MNSTLVAIEVEAFKNFVEPVEFRVDDLAPGLHFVRGINRTNSRLGSNGAGKSTFFSDAVMWCLYGQGIGGLRTTDIKSWLTKKPPRVAVTIRKGRTEHIIQRGPRASALTIDGRTIGQAEVDALIGLDFMAASQAIIWGQSRPLFFDLSPRDKMQILSDALGLDRWERRADMAAGRAKRLGTALEGLRGEILGLETAQNHAELALREAREASEAWSGVHARKLEELASTTAAARARADDLGGRRGEAAMAADKAGTEARILSPEVDSARDALRHAEQACQDADRLLETLDSELAVIIEHRRAFSEKRECPTCHQSVTKKDAAHHLRELRDQKSAVSKKLQTAKRAQEEAYKAREELRDKVVASEAILASLEKDERRNGDEQRALERELATAEAQAASAWQSQKDAEEETNPHRDTASSARKRLGEIKTGLRAATERIDKLEASIERAQFWVRGFRDIRLMIIDGALDDLRETTAAVLEDFGLGEWSVEYSTERETKSGTTQRALSVSIRSPTAPEGVRWESYSGGEGQRLRVAGALALSEVLMSRAGVTLDFRVLDEPTRGMGGSGVDDLCDLLGEYARDAGLRIFFIDHLARDSASFESTVMVETRKNGSAILRKRN